MGDVESAYAGNLGATTKTPGAKTIPVSDPRNVYNVPYEMLDYTFQHEVYVIYRPWLSCQRCKDDLNKSKVRLAEDGDYTCPHTRKNEYLVQMQRFLTEGHTRVSQREETLMDGSIQVSISWLVPKVDEKKLAEAKKRSMSRTSEDPG
jgi:hypothetical protein